MLMKQKSRTEAGMGLRKEWEGRTSPKGQGRVLDRRFDVLSLEAWEEDGTCLVGNYQP